MKCLACLNSSPGTRFGGGGGGKEGEVDPCSKRSVSQYVSYNRFQGCHRQKAPCAKPALGYLDKFRRAKHIKQFCHTTNSKTNTPILFISFKETFDIGAEARFLKYFNYFNIKCIFIERPYTLLL